MSSKDPRPPAVHAKARLALCVLAGLLVMAGALVTAPPAAAYKICADGGACVHEYMAEQALPLYRNPEIDTYFSDIRAGAGEEDQVDHIYNLFSVGGAINTLPHFWDADSGAEDLVEGIMPNAWQKARQLWSIALGAYAKGDKQQAYHYLGHVAHLLEDQTVPTHTHEDLQFPNDDSYEDWVGASAANRNLTPQEMASLVAPKPEDRPIPIPGGTPDKLFFLMHTTNQITDFFASDEENGDAVDPLGLVQSELDTMNTTISRPRVTGQLEDNDDGNNNNDGDLGIIRGVTYIRGIRAVASLYRLFTETVTTPIVSVVIDRVQETQAHDLEVCIPVVGCASDPPDFWARVRIDGRSAQNRGNFADDADDISRGWPYGRDVGTTGSIPVRIEIWDYDGGEGSGATFSGIDEQSDISPGGGLGVDLTVDLAKCLSGADGAITGGVTGKCGVPLTSQGNNGDEASRVTFTIRMTKPTPTVTTQASPGTLLGAPVRDVATVSGGAGPTGDVTFRLYSDSGCTAEVFSSTNALSGLTATSGWYTPTAVGTYYWRATYNGDGSNNPSTAACDAPNESVIIRPFEPPPITKTISGDLNGPLTVGADESVLIDKARVFGPVTVQPGGALTVVNSQIYRGIVANSPDFFSVCGSDVSPPPPLATGQALSVSNAQVPIRIGDPAAGCAGNKWAGTVSLTANLATMMGGNTFARNVSVTNGGPGSTTIKGNTAYATLACSGNNPAPTNAGLPNSGPNETGQCAGL